MDLTIESLWRHARWADHTLLPAMDGAPESARREFAHLIGAMETWLARIQARPSRLPVWPDPGDAISATELAALYDGFSLLIGLAAEAELPATTTYRNSSGREFTGSTLDILTHVPLHSQYHRGKINLLLREAGLDPVPVDYIAWSRGAPAAAGEPKGP